MLVMAFVFSVCLFVMNMIVLLVGLWVMMLLMMLLIFWEILVIFMFGFMLMRTMALLVLLMPIMSIFLMVFLMVPPFGLVMLILLSVSMSLMRYHWWYLRVRFAHTDLLCIHLRDEALRCELSSRRIFQSLMGRLILLIPTMMVTELQTILELLLERRFPIIADLHKLSP